MKQFRRYDLHDTGIEYDAYVSWYDDFILD